MKKQISFSDDLNPGKLAALEEQAQRLGAVRLEVWQRYGSIQGVTLTDRQIRDAWLCEKRTFPVLANAWKETLRDAKANIVMIIEAAIEAPPVTKQGLWNNWIPRAALDLGKYDCFANSLTPCGRMMHMMISRKSRLIGIINFCLFMMVFHQGDDE